MVTKIMQTAHNCSEMNKFAITQPATVGSAREEVELDEQESQVLRTELLK